MHSATTNAAKFAQNYQILPNPAQRNFEIPPKIEILVFLLIIF
jgi:hypothetical protein